MADIAFVKTIGTASSTSTGTTLTVTVPASGVAAGSSIIVSMAINPSMGTVSCTDTRSNSYTVDRDITDGSGTTGVRTIILSAHNVIALTSGNTVTCTHPSVAARALSANQFSGIAPTTPRDQTAAATGNSSVPSSSSTAATTQGLELLFGTIGVEGKSNETFTPGNGYTTIGRVGTNQGNPTNNITVNPEYRLVSVSGSYSATGTLGTAHNWAAAIATYKATIPTKLAVTSVNGGINPTAGLGFSIVIQAQDASGVARNVTTATGVGLSLKTGTGPLGGTLTGTIAAGTNQVTVGGVTYTKAESGVVITASRTSGDVLTAGDSASFSVNPGAASTLTFTTQPGSTTAGSAIPGPPTVAVQDGFGNTITSSTAAITIAIGNNPGGGTLSGTTTKNASGGVATFSDLSINQGGTGYTLTASSTGITGATSSAFNLTGSSGTISGTVARASDGIPINGALVEALQGNVLKGSATTGSTGSYSIVGIAAGAYSVRASASDFATQTQNGVTVTAGATATANFSLNRVIEITSPPTGTTINDFSVLVTGLINPPAGTEVGVNINGYVALLDTTGGFAAMIPVDSQTTSLTATATDTMGNPLGSETIPVSVQPPTSEPALSFRASPAIGIGPLSVTFTLTSLKPIQQIELDLNGDGTFDFTGSTLQGQTFIFQEPGLYYPFVRVTDTSGIIRTAITLVQVFGQNELDAMLQAKWQTMVSALRQGNIELALTYITVGRRSTYQAMFNALTIPLASIDQILTPITLVKQSGVDVEYRMTHMEGGVQFSDLVLFTYDVDGVWRIKFF